MSKRPRFLMIILIISALSIAITVPVALAGYIYDFGQLPGLPLQANYIAWLGDTGTPPSQVLTEDGLNCQSGTNQGYQNQTWILSATEFEPDPDTGDLINFIFGNLSSPGTIWAYSASYDGTVEYTNHGIVGESASGTCPLMLSGSQSGSGKTINWSGTPSQHLIYRSQNACIPGGDTSNGRYSYVASVPADTFTYLDTACPTGTNCWHIVVPADGFGVINGCHSEESSPTAITLSIFSASSHISSPWLLILGVGLLVVMVVTAVILRNNTKMAT